MSGYIERPFALLNVDVLKEEEEEEEDFLYPGGDYLEGIGGASASGAKGRADETIAKILLANIDILVQLEKDWCIQEDQMEI